MPAPARRRFIQLTIEIPERSFPVTACASSILARGITLESAPEAEFSISGQLPENCVEGLRASAPPGRGRHAAKAPHAQGDPAPLAESPHGEHRHERRQLTAMPIDPKTKERFADLVGLGCKQHAAQGRRLRPAVSSELVLVAVPAEDDTRLHARRPNHA